MPQTVFPSRVCHPSNTVPCPSCLEGHCHQPTRGGCAVGELLARSVLPAPRSCSRRPGDGAESPRLPAAPAGLAGGRGATGGGTATRDHRPPWHPQPGLFGWDWGSAVALEPRFCRWGERGVREGRCRGVCVCVYINRDGGVRVCAWKRVRGGAWGFCRGCSRCMLGGCSWRVCLRCVCRVVRVCTRGCVCAGVSIWI